DVAAQAARILGHAPSQLRQRYWKSSGKTVWVLEEIGKEEPITAGFVVANGKILQARVLIYRESRGGEIRFPAFLKQYEGVALDTEQQLDRNIDGISGATLSVRAMGRMARLALYFDNLSQEKK
ncbi:MAG: FMN-binding protein, partial [Methylophilaceae bacterium]|nr:FMN-binding protein [Methylophilaceae bacterium]